MKPFCMLMMQRLSYMLSLYLRGGQLFHTKGQIWKTVEAAGRTLIEKQGEDLFFFENHGPHTNVFSKIRGFHLLFYSNFAPLRLIF